MSAMAEGNSMKGWEWEELGKNERIKIKFQLQPDLCSGEKGRPFRNFYILVEYKELQGMSWRKLLETNRRDRVEGFAYRPEKKGFWVKDKRDNGEGKQGWHMECQVVDFLKSIELAGKKEFGVIVYYPPTVEQEGNLSYQFEEKLSNGYSYSYAEGSQHNWNEDSDSDTYIFISSDESDDDSGVYEV